MKRFINKSGFWICLCVFLLMLFSCNKYLDINKSPLTATEVDAKLLFGYAINAWDANKNSGDAWIPLGLMVQNIASGGDYGWEKSNVYDISPYSLGNTWKVYYSTSGNNLKQAILIAESLDPRNNNAAAQSKIVLAQLIYEATTLYGDIPFSEAWDPVKFPFPKYDAQQDVLNGTLNLLDEAMAQIDKSSTLKIDDYDIYFKGDMLKWEKLANSIKFKILMLMADADPSVAAKIGLLLADESKMINDANESWIHPYYEKENNENPKFRLFKRYSNSKNIWFFGNTNVFNYMHLDDPRIGAYLSQGEGGEYIAVNTEENADKNSSLINSQIYRADAPSILLSLQEVLFFKSEAYARGLGVTKDLVKANRLYKDAVKAACIFYGVSSSNANDFVENKLVDLLSSPDPVREIHLQQWVDLMDRPMEAFVQWRRSGKEGAEVPTLTLPPGATNGPLIRRWLLSPEEITANPNIPSPQPKYFDRMWFDL